MKVISMFKREGVVPVTIAATVAFFLVVSIVQATTTISTDITTQGALSVTGASTLTGNVTAAGTLGVTGASTFTGLVSSTRASSTRLSVFDTAYFGGSATSTFNSAGALSLAGALTGTSGSFSSTLGVTGLTSLIQASSTRLSVFDTAYFGGSATSSFSSAGALTLGGTLTLNGVVNSILTANSSGVVVATSTPTATYFIATSTTVASTFPFASTTAITATTGFFTTSTSTTANANTGNIGTLTVTGVGTFGTATSTTLNANTATIGTLTAGGFVSQASSTVVGALTVTGTFSPAQTSASSFTVSGLTTLGQASSTRLSVHDTAYFGGSATSTFNSAGALNLVAALTGTSGSFSTTLGVTGLTSLIQASSTRLSVHDTAYFGGSATSSFSSAGVLTLVTALAVASGGTGVTTSTGTGNTVLSASPTLSGTAVLAAANFSGLASTTQLRVGNDNVNTISGLIQGFCTASITATASTSAYANCTGATGVTSSYKVFLQATSSLPSQLVLQAASSTATDGTINIEVLNTGITGGNVSTSINSFNFWAVR